jgi:hypothetical protein
MDKYPNLPFHAAAMAAEDMAAERMKGVKSAAAAAGVEVLGGQASGILDGLLARTGSIIGKKLSEAMEQATSDLIEGVEGFVDEASFRDSFMPNNQYLVDGSITDHLDHLAERLDEDDNCLDIYEDEETGEEFLRLEMSFPIELLEAIMQRDKFKVEFVDWLTESFHDDDTDEEDDGGPIAYEL